MMIGKRLTPVIGKLTGASVSGSREDASTSPKSPLDFKIQSPRGLKGYDFGGVGLAIVTSLENENSSEIQAVYNRNSKRSIPIPVNSTKNTDDFNETEMGFEEYTVVTCRKPDNKSYTRVYCDRPSFQVTKCNRPSVFNISPPKFGDFPAYPDSDFLSSCHLCHKKLHDKDIYMYRGEKAFCSTECRYRQIVMDEHKDKCSSEVSRSADIACSPYSNSQVLSTGILAI